MHGSIIAQLSPVPSPQPGQLGVEGGDRLVDVDGAGEEENERIIDILCPLTSQTCP